MTAERDTDRHLRAWLADGADRAPERFVWAALDEVERLPQAAPWRSAFGSWWVRWRPASAVLGTTAAVLILAAVALRIAAPNLGAGDTARDLTVDDLAAIVVWESTKPGDWSLDSLITTADEVWRIPIRSLSADEVAALPAPEGYLGGRYADFSGPDAVYISWATVFDSDLDAASALPFYLAEFESSAGWGLGPGTGLDLGRGGFVYAGETTRLVGDAGEPVPARIYLWRHGNALLAIGGWFAFDSAELDTLAAGMDQRAADLAGGRT